MKYIHNLIFVVFLATVNNVVQGQECTKLKTVQISIGSDHTIFLMSNGDMYSTGSNTYGQLGLGNNVSSKDVPTKIDGVKDVGQISAGLAYSLCTTKEGVMYSWGVGGYLGNGNSKTNYTPGKIADGEIEGGNIGINFISKIYTHCLFIKEGVVYGFGENDYRQVREENNDLIYSPVKISEGNMGNTGISTVSVGYGYSLALKGGVVYSWGNNGDGQLGDGTTTMYKLSPVKVADGDMINNEVTSIVSGGGHSLALKDGVIYSWGNNSYGELGDGTTTHKRSPIRVIEGVMGNDDIIDVSIASSTSYALKSSGEIYAWGQNKFGQLGDGTETNIYTPVKVVDGEMGNIGITYLSGSPVALAMMVIKQDKIYAWGRNAERQYGNGGKISSKVPIHIGSELEDIDEYPVELESKTVGNNIVELTITGDEAPYDIFKDGIWMGSYYENKVLLALDLNVENNILVQNKYGCQGEIAIGGNFIVKINKEDEGCEGKGDGMIEVVIEKGEAPYSVYLDEQEIESPYKIEDLSKGQYSVKVIDNTNDIRIFDVEIEIKPAIVISVTNVKKETCGNDGSIDIEIGGGTAPYEVILKIGESEIKSEVPEGNTHTFGELNSAVYVIEVVDARDCKKEISNIEIETTPELKITAANIKPEACGNDGSVDINIEGGTKPYDVILKKIGQEPMTVNTSSSTCTLDKLVEGTYSIEVIDAGDCKKEISNIDIGTTQKLRVTMVNIKPEICGSDGSIDMRVEGGTIPYKVILKIGEEEVKIEETEYNTHTFGELTGATYSVEVIDARDCEKEISNIEIETTPELKVTTVNIKPEACGNDGSIDIEMEGGTIPYKVILKKLGQESTTISTSINTHTLDKLVEGTYSIEVIDAGGCKKEISNIEIGTTPELKVTVVNMEPEICGNDGNIDIKMEGGSEPYEVVLKIGGEEINREKPEGDTYTFDKLSSATYSVEISDARGCKKEISNIEIGMTQELKITEINMKPEMCGSDGSISIKIEGGMEPYELILKIGNEEINRAEPDGNIYTFDKLIGETYSIEISDARGCTGNEIQVVESNNVSISLDKGKESCGDFEDGWIELSINTNTIPYDIYLNDSLVAEKITEKYKIDGLSKGVYNLKLVGVENECEISETVKIEDEATCSEYIDLNCLGKPYIVFKGEEKLVFECVNKDTYKINLRIIDGKGAIVYKNDDYDNVAIKGIKEDTYLTLFYIVQLIDKNTGLESKTYASYIERIKKD